MIKRVEASRGVFGGAAHHLAIEPVQVKPSATIFRSAGFQSAVSFSRKCAVVAGRFSNSNARAFRAPQARDLQYRRLENPLLRAELGHKSAVHAKMNRERVRGRDFQCSGREVVWI